MTALAARARTVKYQLFNAQNDALAVIKKSLYK